MVDQTAISEYSLITPSTWEHIDLADGVEAEATRLAAQATAGLPKDSAAVERHWIEKRIREALAAFDERDDAKVEHVMFPRQGAGETTELPLTMVCGRIRGIEIPEGSRPVEVLVGLAHHDADSVPMDVDGVVAVRSARFTDVTAEFAGLVDEAPGDRADLEQARIAMPSNVYSMRATYVFASPGEDPTWHMISISTLLPTDDRESEIVEVVVGLADAIVGSLRWSDR